MSTDRKKLALAYLEAVATPQYDKVEGLLAPDLRFRGPAMTRTSAGEVLAALKRRAAEVTSFIGARYLHGFDVPDVLV